VTAPTLYEWFARSAERHPDAVALELGDEAITYRDLRGCAETVAGLIVSAHGGAPERVALLAGRSKAAFASYLAALRLGAAVVPLNPAHPVRRNEIICGGIQCEVLIADQNGHDQLDALRGTAGTAIQLPESQVTSGPPVPLPELRTGGEDIAYILFTSGSTGRPKGVPITHRNASAYIQRNIARYHIGPGHRMSHTFDLTFDLSVFDLFVSWGGGATLVSPGRNELLRPVDYLAGKSITHWFSVPSVISVSAELGNLAAGRALELRQSIFCGERLTCAQAAAWHSIAPQAGIDNVYGPTELTVACTEYRLPAKPENWPTTSNDTVPIGSVYENLEYVITDSNGSIADEGELCIRGVQRFAGYIDPADNQGRFLTLAGDRYLPYEGTKPEPEQYYRTGDRVRWEGGELVHLGRLDHQVKVRGYRVELGEIESVMGRHPGVTQAVVIALLNGDDTELVGFYTGAAAPDRDFIRFLRQRLPIHMVPRRLQHTTSLPLNANGKVDRSALQSGLLASHIH
jgi:amino acid adenylation domain-containing protein